MKKLIFPLLLVLITGTCFAQSWQTQAGTYSKPDGMWPAKVFRLPSDTTTNKTGLAQLGNRVFAGNGTFWKELTASSGGGVALVDTFNSNPILYLPVGFTLGKYKNGDIAPWNGLTARQALLDAIVQAIPPTYYNPVVSISSTPVSGNYERGFNLGTITLSNTYTANDAGSSNSTTYYNNGTPLSSNTVSVSNLTSSTSFYVAIGYAQGACKNNNLGNLDCTGRINSGTINSGSISFTPFDKRYWGFVSSTSPGNSTILALSQDNNGATGSLTLSNVTPSGSQYLAYFTKGTVSSVTVNGIPATGAFTFTTFSVTNAQGYASTYTYVYSNNPQTSTLSSVIFN